ncbi:MAG: hypothetical protein H6707_09490 [Deltaproteobacteria bacterium]|nr:hypothetical protein [Deltaproteobacteria bacterium]
MAGASGRFVILTGASEGLGNAVLYWALRRFTDQRIIGISRRPRDEIDRLDQLTPTQLERYEHVRADLAIDTEVERVVGEISQRVQTDDGMIASIILVNGTGYLDTDVAENPQLVPLMETLNIRTPLALAKGLEPLLEPTAPIFYFSGVVAHPSITDPSLRTHAGIKKRAVREFQETFPDRAKVVMPGAYETAMLRRNIVRRDAPLEWYSMPMSNPFARRGIADYIARMSIRPTAKVPSPIIRPRGVRLLVGTHSNEALRRSLPRAIRMTARTVLSQTGQCEQDHDQRVEYFRSRQAYGEGFPYEALVAERLWPAWASRAYVGMLRTFRMLT